MNKYSDPEFHALHGATYYNASTMHEQLNWRSNALEGWDRYRTGAMQDEQKLRLLLLFRHLDNAATVFKAERDNAGITKTELRMAMTMVYAAETSFGVNSSISSTGVIGAVQVTRGTFRDLVRQGILGNKAAKYLGFSDRRSLLALTRASITAILKTYNGCFLAGTGKYLQTLDK